MVTAEGFESFPFSDFLKNIFGALQHFLTFHYQYFPALLSTLAYLDNFCSLICLHLQTHSVYEHSINLITCNRFISHTMASKIYCISFNQDDSCLGVGTDNSFSIFNCEPFGRCFNKDSDAKIVEMLFSTPLVATVGLGYNLSSSSKKLIIVNTKRKYVICELSFPSTVLFVKMNRERLVVAISGQIYIYDVSCMKLLHKISIPPFDGPFIADMCPADSSILAYCQTSDMANTNSQSPTSLSLHSKYSNLENSASAASSSAGSSANQQQENQLLESVGTHLHEDKSQGAIMLFDALNHQPLNRIQCHKSPLRTITLSKDGSLIATASVKGTIIRVFASDSGRKVYEFRRGTYSAHISCLRFNSDNSILACSSNTGTIHLFRLDHRDRLNRVPGNEDPNRSNPQSTNDISISTNDGIIANSSLPNKGDDQDTDEQSFPYKAVMTDEENYEIENLIRSRLSMPSASGTKDENSITHKLFNKGKQSTKALSSFLWKRSKNYIPPQFNSIFEPARDYAYIKLSKEIPSVVSVVDNSCFIATFDGEFLVYRIPSKYTTHSQRRSPGDRVVSGQAGSKECVLLKEYKLI